MTSRFTFATGAVLVLGFPAVFGQLSPEEMDRLDSQLPAAASGTVRFERDIRPIFDRSCLQCHGPERPRSRFRIDARDEALKGGSGGVAIVPGDSAGSPLIYYVANLVEEMEMPPPGKAPPLSPGEIGLLRAWIDQGAQWSSETPPPKYLLSITPALQAFTVRGSEQKFREHTGAEEGFNPGLHSLYFEQQSGPRKLTVEARTFFHPDEYRLRLQLEQRDLGYVRLGFEQYREYYSDGGGVYPFFDPSQFALGEDLYLDAGRVWADFVLTLPDKPRVRLGYEYRYRDGSKSTLQWGDADATLAGNPPGADARKIFPARKEIDEDLHIVKFDVAHEVNGIGFENNFRAEFYDSTTRRENTLFFNNTTGRAEKYVIAEDRHEHFQASDSFFLQKQVLDWLYLSGGYYFSRVEGEYGFSAQTISPAGIFSPDDPFWFADTVILEQSTHILNGNLQLGPWDGLTIFGGVQSEWMTQRGFGDVRLDEGIPGTLHPEPATVDSDLDRSSFDEHIGARYTKIPFTVLFAESRFSQEFIGQYETQFGGHHDFLRDTDATSRLFDGRVGFTFSPWTRASFTAHYKYRNRDARYDHLRDEQPGGKNEGYSAFITSRETETDEISLKLSLRPAPWFRMALTFQKVATDYFTGTDEYILPELVIPGLPPLPAQVLAPGDVLFAGNYDADIYGLNFTVAPWRRLALSSTLNYRTSRTSSTHSLTDAVVAYEGESFSAMSTATFAVNPATDLIGSYTFSTADYSQDNFMAGLPVGLKYDWHVVGLMLNRRFRNDISATLQYRFYYYDEPRTAGRQNYTAHGAFAAVTIPL